MIGQPKRRMIADPIAARNCVAETRLFWIGGVQENTIDTAMP